MPLGIRLAAAWVEMLTLEEIAVEIGARDEFEQSAAFLDQVLRNHRHRAGHVRAEWSARWADRHG